MNTRKLELWILLADIAWIGAAFLTADLLRYGTVWEPGERAAIHALLPFLLTTCFAWAALSMFMPLDGFRGGWRLSAVFSHVLMGTGFTLALIAVLGYFTRSYVSRLALAYFILLLGAGFMAIRCGARMMLRRRHRLGDVWRVVVLGSGRVAQELAAKMEQHPEMLCKVVGLLVPNQSAEGLGLQKACPRISTLEIVDLLRHERVNEVIVAEAYPLTQEIRSVIGRIRDMGIATSIVPEHYELYASKPSLINLDGLPLLQLREPGLRRRYVILKRSMDLVISTLLLIPCFVALMPIAALLWLKGKSAFRWETRSGQYGSQFQMLRLNVERPAPAENTLECFLERFSISELPQVWNVFLGQMSLVGPRPESPRLSSRYSEWQQRRLRVRPGMTGFAQVHGLREYSSSEEKTRFDLQYVMDPYFLLDVSLLLQTVWTLMLRILPTRHNTSEKLRVQPAQPGLLSHAHSTQSSTD